MQFPKTEGHTPPKPVTTTTAGTANPQPGAQPVPGSAAGGAAGNWHNPFPPRADGSYTADTFGTGDRAGGPAFRAAHPELQDAWTAIDSLQDQSAISQEDYADKRRTLALSLGVSPVDVNQERYQDQDWSKRQETAKAIMVFAGSSHPDPAVLDRPDGPMTLKRVLAMLDENYGPLLSHALGPVLTLLALRQAGAGSHFDPAVVQHYHAASVTQADMNKTVHDNEYSESEAFRNNFLKSAADGQACLHEITNWTEPLYPPDDPELAQALQRLGRLYRQDMNLQQRHEIIAVLERRTGVLSDAPADMGVVLEKLLRWHRTSRAGAVPPPLPDLLAAVLALGWHQYRDEKSRLDGTSVSTLLTGHADLPDALVAGLLWHHRRHAGLAPGIHQPENPSTGQHASEPPIWTALQSRLSGLDQPSDTQFDMQLEAAIASCGPNLATQLRGDPTAADRISGPLQQCTPIAAKRERIAGAMVRLTDLLRDVVLRDNPEESAILLSLYRSLGIPAFEATLPLTLNRVFRLYPGTSPAHLVDLVNGFAEKMRSHGYSQAQTQALKDAATGMRTHWEAARQSVGDIERCDDQSFDRLLASRIDTLSAGLTSAVAPLREVEDSGERKVMAQATLQALKQHGFGPELQDKVQRDLTEYLLKSSVDGQAAIDARYRKLLLEPDQSLGHNNGMRRAVQALLGAIQASRTQDAPDVSRPVTDILKPLRAHGASLADIRGLLLHFWGDAEPVVLTPAALEILESLAALKTRRAPTVDGVGDPVPTAAFNNAVREGMARILCERLPGFGPQYADALQPVAGEGYGDLTERMRQRLRTQGPGY